MDHGSHDHSGHDMPGMPSGGSGASSGSGGEMPMPMNKCSMNMLWNSQVANTCVVFESWHISGWMTMLISCIFVTLVSIFYAYLLHTMKRLDRSIAYTISSDAKNGNLRRDSAGATIAGRRESLITAATAAAYQSVEGGPRDLGVIRLPYQARVIRAGMYALCVSLSFWLMLVAMTFNTFLFTSIVLGAFIGHLLYEGEIDVGMLTASTKGLACH